MANQPMLDCVATVDVQLGTLYDVYLHNGTLFSNFFFSMSFFCVCLIFFFPLGMSAICSGEARTLFITL